MHARTCQSRAAHLGCERVHIDHAAASSVNPSLNSAPHHTAVELEEIQLRGNQATATASLASLATLLSPPQHALKHAEALKLPAGRPRGSQDSDLIGQTVPRGRTCKEQRLLGMKSGVTV